MNEAGTASKASTTYRRHPLGNWELPPKQGHMDMADGIYVQNMTIKQVLERIKTNDVLIIPVGATENHGPNAPLGEDIFLVTRMAELVAQRTGCTVSQPLWFGSHPFHHMGMPGTVIVPEEIFVGMLQSMIAGFWNMGFRKQIILNGHGQEYVIPIAIHRFAKTYQVPAIVINLNWYHAIQDHFKLKSQGGPYETHFIHADEVETSWSLLLFPELMHQEWAVDTTPRPLIKDGHVDKAGNLLHRPIAWYGHVGLSAVEWAATPEGVVGKATLADPEKARSGCEKLLDYMVTLIDDILEAWPPGQLPPPELLTQRPREEIEAVLKYPFEPGWRSLYSLHYPPA